MPPRELLAQEDAAPEHGRRAVGRDDGRGVHDVVLVRDGVDVRELTGRLKERADIFRRLALGQEAVVPDELDVYERHHRREQKRQLIGAVGGVRVKAREHAAVGKRAGRVEQAVGHRQREGEPALGVAVVRGRLARAAQLVVLARLDHAEPDHAGAHEHDGGQRHDAHPAAEILVQPAEAQVQHRHHRAGGVADRRRDGQLDIPQADVAERHRHDVQQRHGQVRPDDVPRHAHAANEDLIRRVQAHDDADGDDHF